jgi:hypothetical protein
LLGLRQDVKNRAAELSPTKTIPVSSEKASSFGSVFWDVLLWGLFDA